MHVDEHLPVVFRSPLQHHPSHRMARGADALRVPARLVLEVDHAALGLERRRPHLFRREAEMIREVAHDVARVRRLDFQAVERHHAADRPFPSLRRVAAEGNARHHAALVGPVTRSTRGLDLFVGDGDARLARLCWRRRLLRTRRGSQDGCEKKTCKSNCRLTEGAHEVWAML
jgi:hypothetical protein